MPKTTHTPGPWYFARPVPGKAFAIHAPTRAICGGIGSGADARLIAAAPALAEALRECVFQFEHLYAAGGSDAEVLDNAIAALKAAGVEA